MTGVALLAAGAIASVILTQEVTDRVNGDLVSDVAEFERLVDVGVDPGTGEAFASPAAAVRTALARIIPDPNEGTLGYLNGSLEWVSRDATLPLQDDPAFVEAVAPFTLASDLTYTSIDTDAATYHVAIAPVTTSPEGALVLGGDASGASDVAALVLAYDLDQELGLFLHAFEIYAIVAAIAWLVVSAAAWVIAGRLLRPIGTLAATASRIGRDDLTERIPVTGSDDVSAMTASVNGMLDRLEGAFRAQSDLLNDVSHELRTPITVVRGHLELMDEQDPQDAREVRDLSIGELDRMASLVADLLTLAKADRPDFVVARPTDVSDVVTATLEKATSLGERQWVLGERADAVVALDRDRITQALLQLAANAVKFSEPDSAITIGAVIDDADLRLWVQDQGIGIPPEDQARVFERFAQSKNHEREGSGLGLSIVTAIAHAHHGRVDVASTPGEGSTFTLVLPSSTAHPTVIGATE